MADAFSWAAHRYATPPQSTSLTGVQGCGRVQTSLGLTPAQHPSSNNRASQPRRPGRNPGIPAAPRMPATVPPSVPASTGTASLNGCTASTGTAVPASLNRHSRRQHPQQSSSQPPAPTALVTLSCVRTRWSTSVGVLQNILPNFYSLHRWL